MPTAKLISPITRQELKKTKVAAYCRVSTNSADQQNSYATQVRIYTNMIKARPDWELVEIFADEGLSGTKSENRTSFQRMLRMCELHGIDLILVKSVSRFARNTKETLEYCRKLKLLGVGVQFEKEGINTLALGDEMLLNTFAAIAQEESVSISQNVRLSIFKQMESGEYVNGTVPFGFRLQNKVMVPYEPEAEIVRKLFEMYLAGHSTTELVRYLEDEHIVGKSGKSNWNIRTVSHILSNEKYVGDTLYRKKYRETTVPFKQHINYGQEDQYYASGTHEGIVTREIFDAVQALLGKRQAIHGKVHENCIYPFTSRIHCTECGSFYRRRVLSGGVKWGCQKHIANSASCNSFYYSEERIEDGFVAMVNKLRFGEENILAIVIDKLERVSRLYKKSNTDAYEITKEIAELNAKLVMLEQLRSKGYLAPEVFQAQSRDINNQLNELKNSRQETLDNRILQMLGEVHKLKALIDEVEEPLERFDEKLFHDIVKEMKLNNKDELTITVLGGLKFTELI